MKDINRKIAEAVIDSNRNIKLRVADNFNTSTETLDKLSKSKDLEIRRRVSRNGNTAPETLDKLASDKDQTIRENVAGNFNTTQNTLDKLAKAKEIEMAKHKSTASPVKKASTNKGGLSYSWSDLTENQVQFGLDIADALEHKTMNKSAKKKKDDKEDDEDKKNRFKKDDKKREDK